MPHGLSGRPKSPEHKRKISEGVRRAQRKAAFDVRGMQTELDTLLYIGEFSSVESKDAALTRVIEWAADAVVSMKNLGNAKEREYLRKIDKLRDELEAMGARLRTADLFELRALARAGLVDKGIVEAEALRRQREFPTTLSRNGGLAPASGGYSVCGEKACSRMISSGALYCSEHLRAEPRSFISPNFTSVDLDALLEAAQRRCKKAEAEAAKERAEVDALVERISTYDRGRGEDNN